MIITQLKIFFKNGTSHTVLDDEIEMLETGLVSQKSCKTEKGIELRKYISMFHLEVSKQNDLHTKINENGRIVKVIIMNEEESVEYNIRNEQKQIKDYSFARQSETIFYQ